jgi:hypothetical protein
VSGVYVGAKGRSGTKSTPVSQRAVGNHRDLTPAEFADQVPDTVWASLPQSMKLGWDTLVAVLHFAEGERIDRYEGNDKECNKYCTDLFGNIYWRSKHMGTLWAAIQTELVTYRRLEEGDPWLSENFNMQVVRDGALTGTGFAALPLVEKQMLRPHCRHGVFQGCYPGFPSTTEDACAFYFCNMEDWGRSNFIQVTTFDD